jgi:hypothetical protein
MSRVFSHYDSISYTEKCKGVNKLNKKRSQALKILEITTTSSHVQNYTKNLMENFWVKVMVYFGSGVFSSFLSNFFDFYVEKVMEKSGLDEKVKKMVKVKAV